MCRLAWQLLGMLGNVLSLLGMLRNVESHIEEKPPTCCIINCESKGVVYHQVSCRGRRGRCKACLGHCKACLGRCEACRGGRGRCQACLGVAKQAYTS